MCRKNFRFFLFILFLPFAIFAQEERSEKSFSVKPNGGLELKADFGLVDVRSWAQNEVKVEVLKWVEGRHRRSAKELFEDYEIRYNQTERGVSIVAEMRGRNFWRGNDGLQVEFRIMAPKQYNLDLNTSGGEVECDLPVTMQGKFGESKLRGKLNGGGPLLTLRTSGGDIELRSR